MAPKKKILRPNPFSVPLDDAQLKFIRKGAAKTKSSMAKFLRDIIEREMARG